MAMIYGPPPNLLRRRLLLGAGLLAGAFGSGEAAQQKPGKAVPNPTGQLPLVMLDPGHGGKDPGAIGVVGTFEKHIALAAAQELRRQLLASGRYRVALTRTRDMFIGLDERVDLAQRQGAALFVSMHADALADRTIRGASVYTLGDVASDQQTASLAVRENAGDRAGPSGSPEVAKILGSLVRQETKAGSARMARTMVKALGHDLPLLPHPRRQASFVVLKAADIPSVLVEMGFMSNREDEAALRRAEHRKVVAAAMKRAVDGFFATLSIATSRAG